MDRENYTSELRLIQALKAGEPPAYEKIYREALPSVKSFVYLNNGHTEDALDLLQEAIIVLFRKLQEPDFVLTCKVTTYIYSVCRNKWLNQLRKQVPGKNLFDTDNFEEVPDEAPDEEQARLDQKFTEVFNQLDEKCQRILVKYYFYCHSLDEIANALDLPNANAVKVKKFRCIQKLKDGLR